MKKYSLLIILFIILIGYLSLTVNSALVVKNEQKISLPDKSNLIRLHLIANSNTPKDQFIKRKVRQKVLDYMKNNKSKIKIDDVFIKEIKNLTEKEIRVYNAQYPAKVNLGYYFFPRRTYGNLTLPPGEYRALNIELGAANGSNWWCVLNPPLCLNIKESKGNETEQIKFKFKIVELFSNINNNKSPIEESHSISYLWKVLSSKNLNLYLK